MVEVEDVSSVPEEDIDIFVGVVGRKAKPAARGWQIKLVAEVSVLPATAYKNRSRQNAGPGDQPLEVTGYVNTKLSAGRGQCIVEKVYIVKSDLGSRRSCCWVPQQHGVLV